MRTFIVTLNWNTTEMLFRMMRSVHRCTRIPVNWIIVDNGSDWLEWSSLQLGIWDAPWVSDWGLLNENDLRVSVIGKVLAGVENIVVRNDCNRGCIVGHNEAFDAATILARGGPFQIVMIDTDVEITEVEWLWKAIRWAEDHPEVGIVGMEHTEAELCAPAVFIDTNGNWYLHQTQTMIPEPAEAETVGLGLALIRWPVLGAGLRFDPAFHLYYKQDDDLCFQVRADLGLEVWAFPVGCVHWGSGSLKANDYNVVDAHGWDEFDQVKQNNQAYFVKKWRWALADRRRNMEEQAKHLAEMKVTMREHRKKGE